MIAVEGLPGLMLSCGSVTRNNVTLNHQIRLLIYLLLRLYSTIWPS